MELNYLAIVVAAVGQFIVGAIWYGPVFGKLWGKMHNCDALPPEELKLMQKKMVPFYLLQFVLTVITTVVLALFVAGLLAWNVFGIAGFMWLGFVLPAQISSVIFGGTEGKWVMKKILVMAFGTLLCLEVAALVFFLF